MSVMERILIGEFTNIIILTGAGISTKASIPCYRSKYGLFFDILKVFPRADGPSDLFSRSFVETYSVEESEIYQEKIKLIEEALPTSTHYFCNHLYRQGWLKRVYTQNIDSLHQKAGLPEDMVIEYHGSLIKNNVVLYGDAIMKEIITQTLLDFADLIIVMGSSLQVSPFCALPNLVNKQCTRILVDLEPSNAYKNEWSKKKADPTEMYNCYSDSTIKFGSRTVSLRPQWKKPDKWKKQYVIQSDCDTWVNSTDIKF